MGIEKENVQKNLEQQHALARFKELLSKRERIWVGGDIRGEPESGVVKAKDHILIKVRIPKGYLRELGVSEEDERFTLEYLLSSGRYTTRSSVAQAGLYPLFPHAEIHAEEKDDSYFFTGALNNRNHARTYNLPSGHPYLRLVTSPEQTEVTNIPSDLAEQVHTTNAPFTMELGRFGVFKRERTLDLGALTSNRAALDEQLGIEWSQVIENHLHPRLSGTEWVLGEAEHPIRVPDNFALVVNKRWDPGKYVHANSWLIDPGFNNRVRTEYELKDPEALPQEIQFTLHRA